ncbi:MAG: hypothetical protein ABIH87_01225 [bacterium]
MLNTKRTILIILLLLATILIGLAIYFFLFKQQSPFDFFTNDQTTTTTVETLPGSGQRVVTSTDGTIIGAETLPTAQITQQPVQPSYFQPKAVEKITSDYAIFPSLNQDGGYRYHNASDGKFYSITDSGESKLLADKVFYNVSKVTWAETKDKAVIEYPDDSKIIYDFENNKQVSLPKHWEDFSFSPEGSEIVAKSLGISTENRWLITMNDDGTGLKTIEPMGNNADYVTVDWSPSRQVIAFSNTGEAIGADRTEILLVGLNKENFKALTIEGNGFESEWSPTGKKLLYSAYSARSEYKPELWISDAYGDSVNENRQMLNINTWPDKCSFGDDNTIYCAVPRSLPEGAGMSKAIANSIYDDLYKIDLSTGLKTPISLDDNYTIQNISFDKKNNKLLFTDIYDSGVFEVSL